MEQVDLTHPITEDDIANFLIITPDFFERHAEVLASVQLTSPHGQRAVGLQQRQAEMLREKIKLLESRIVQMIGHAHENAQLAAKLEQWSCELLRVERPAQLPPLLTAELARQFELPQVALKLWALDPQFADAPFAQGVSEDVIAFTQALQAPFCGLNSGFEAVNWLEDPAVAISLALIPLRWPVRAEAAVPQAGDADADRSTALQVDAAPAAQALSDVDIARVEPTLDGAAASDDGVAPRTAANQPACGLLLLASPDPKRFQPGMGTEFLQRLADLAGAALSRLRPAAAGTEG